MKTPFKVSINRSHSSDGDTIRFEIKSLSGGLWLDFDMNLENFAKCVTGLSACETEIGDIYGSTDRIHKVRIWKHYRVEGDFNLPYKQRDEAAYAILLEQQNVKDDIAGGWDLSNSFCSQGDINSKGIMAKFYKWVPVDEIPEEFKSQHSWMGVGYDTIETLKVCKEK